MTMGVRLLVHLPQVLQSHMGVNLGGGQIRMPQQLLHNPDIQALVQEVRGETMPEHVGGDFFADTETASSIPQ
jgi:hypothetical protein